VVFARHLFPGRSLRPPARSFGVFERASQAEPARPAQPESRSEPPVNSGPTGVLYALAAVLIVVAWLVLCMFLRQVF